MAENRKQVLDKFQEHVELSYENYCDRHGIQKSFSGFISFLIDHELIGPVTIKRYTVIKEFKETYPLHNYHKTKTVLMLSDKFNIPERTIWGILKYGEQFSSQRAIK